MTALTFVCIVGLVACEVVQILVHRLLSKQMDCLSERLDLLEDKR